MADCVTCHVCDLKDEAELKSFLAEPAETFQGHISIYFTQIGAIKINLMKKNINNACYSIL